MKSMLLSCVLGMFFSFARSAEVLGDSGPIVSNPEVSPDKQAIIIGKDHMQKAYYEIGMMYLLPSGAYANQIFTVGGFNAGNENQWTALFGEVKYPPNFYTQSTFPYKLITSEVDIQKDKVVAFMVFPKRHSTRDISQWQMDTAFLHTITVMNQSAVDELVSEKICDSAISLSFEGTSISSGSTPPVTYEAFQVHMRASYTYLKGSKAYILSDAKGNKWIMTASWQNVGDALDANFNNVIAASTFPAGWSGEIIPSLKEEIVVSFNASDGTVTFLQDPDKNNYMLLQDKKNPGIAADVEVKDYLWIPDNLAEAVAAALAQEEQDREEDN